MNNEIPSIWLLVSGIFFLFGIVVFATTGFVLYKALKLMEELKPRIDSLTNQVEALVVKVEGVVDKVDGVAEKVNGIATSVKSSVDGVGGGAKRVMGTIDQFSTVATGKVEGIAPYISLAMAAFKVFKTFQGFRAKTTKAKQLPARKDC